MAGSLVGALRVTLGIDTAAFEEGLGIAQKRLNAAGKKMQEVGDRMASVGSTLSVAVTAPLAVFGASSIKAASDAAELQSAFDQTFGGMAEELTAWAEATGDAMGRSTQSIQQAANTFGIFFNQAAPTRKEAAEMSKTFAVLAQDLASFYNVTESDALAKLRSGLSGESEPLRDFGVFLTEAAVKAKAFELGLGSLSGGLSEQDKIMARYAIILEKTTNAQGDVARTSGGTANQIRAAQAAFDELQVTVGTKLLPVLTPLITTLAGVLDSFSGLDEGTQSFIIGAAAIAAAVGPVLFVIGSVASVIGSLIPVFAPVVALLGGGGLAGVFTALGAAIAPFLLPIAAIAAVGALIYANWDKIGPVLEEFGAKVSAVLGPKLQSLIETVKTTLTELWNGPLGEMIRTVIDWIGKLGAVFLELFGEAIIRVVSALISFLDAQFKIIGDIFNVVIALLSGDFAGAWEAMKSLIGNVVTGVINILNSLAPGAIKSVSDMVNGVRQWVVGRLSAIWDTVIERIEAVKRAFFFLYDAVVGNSYVPDMVDEIGQNMARLQKLMVDPAKAATTATKNAFRDLAGDVSGLLDTLFPVQAQLRSVLDDIALLEKARASGLVNPGTFDSARDKLLTEKFALQNQANPLPVLVAEQMQPFKIALIELEQVLIQLPRVASEAEIALTDLGNRLGNDIMGGIADILTGRGGFKEVISDLFSRFLEDTILTVLKGLETQAFGEGGLGSVVGSLFGSIFGGAPGFALGGSFKVGGRPGRDANLVAFRATRGETVDISTSDAAQANGGGMALGISGAPVVNITNTIDASGADPAAIARLNTKLDQMNAELPGKIVRTVQDASDRRVIKVGGR